MACRALIPTTRPKLGFNVSIFKARVNSDSNSFISSLSERGLIFVLSLLSSGTNVPANAFINEAR